MGWTEWNGTGQYEWDGTGLDAHEAAHDGKEQDGLGWGRMGWDGAGWDGMGCAEWNGTGQYRWDRMKQDGMQRGGQPTPVSSPWYLSGAVAERGSRFYGISDGYIFLDNNKCAGNESSLLECPNTNADPEVCNHDLDAGATCKG